MTWNFFDSSTCSHPLPPFSLSSLRCLTSHAFTSRPLPSSHPFPSLPVARVAQSPVPVVLPVTPLCKRLLDSDSDTAKQHLHPPPRISLPPPPDSELLSGSRACGPLVTLPVPLPAQYVQAQLGSGVDELDFTSGPQGGGNRGGEELVTRESDGAGGVVEVVQELQRGGEEADWQAWKADGNGMDARLSEILKRTSGKQVLLFLAGWLPRMQTRIHPLIHIRVSRSCS